MAWFRTGGGGIPASLKNRMNAVLNKKLGTSAQEYPPNGWPDDVNLLGLLEEKTQASASVCSFDDGADDVPTKSLVVTIPPTISGVSSVTETQTGKNLLNANDSSYTFQVGDNYRYNCGTVSLKKGVTYTFSALQEDALTSNTRNTLVIGVNEVYTYESATGTNYHNQSGVHSMQYTPSEDCNAVFLVWVHTPSNAVKYSAFMVEVGSTAYTYEPYHTPTVYTASLGRTIYGGQADIVNGIGTDENGNDFTFTGQKVPTRLGYNAFWSDEGDTEVTYRSSGTVTPVLPTLISKTITENGTYSAEDDGADGYDEVTVNVSGGGGEQPERLVYFKGTEQYTGAIPPAQSIDYGAKYSEYLSYDSTTKKFTVLKAFDAMVTCWVREYRDYYSDYSYGGFQKNGVTVCNNYRNSGQAINSVGGTWFYLKFAVGDTFNAHSETNAYPQQHFKVYLLDLDMPSNFMAFIDEEA